MVPPPLVSLGLRHILVRATIISSGGSLDKTPWKDISIDPHPPPHLSAFRFPPSPRIQEESYIIDHECHTALVTIHLFPQKALPDPVPLAPGWLTCPLSGSHCIPGMILELYSLYGIGILFAFLSAARL